MRGVVLISVLLFFLACGKKEHLPPIDHSVDLDGDLVLDSSLIDPPAFLLSAAIPSPSEEDRDKTVFIALHGFSAGTFEWREFHSWCRGKGDVLVSRVLLGGHGRNYRAFRDASWADWANPAVAEYERLRAMGYRKINFIAASTGCPLVAEFLHERRIEQDVLRHVFFIDPIIVPSNKQLSLAPLVGGTLVKYTESGLDPGETGYWYKFRPQEALRELNKLTRHVRKLLEKGVKFDEHVSTWVYKSEKDGSADPVSAVLLGKGLSRCEVSMVNSDLHVFTRLAGRPEITEQDRKLQQETFEAIYLRASQ